MDVPPINDCHVSYCIYTWHAATLGTAHAAHKSPDYFQNPEEFDPSRLEEKKYSSIFICCIRRRSSHMSWKRVCSITITRIHAQLSQEIQVGECVFWWTIDNGSTFSARQRTSSPSLSPLNLDLLSEMFVCAYFFSRNNIYYVTWFVLFTSH